MMSMSIDDVFPTGYRVLVKPKNVHEKRKESIIALASETLEKEMRGTTLGEVVKIGPDAYDQMESKWCEVGDTVYFTQYERTVLDIDDEKYFIINDEHIVAKVCKND